MRKWGLVFFGAESGEDAFLKGGADVGSIALWHSRALDEEDVDETMFGVGPALGAVGAAVAEGARGLHGGHVLGLGLDFETEAHGDPRSGGRWDDLGLGGGEVGDGLGFEEGFVAKFSLIEHHLVKMGDVLGGGEESRARCGWAFAVDDSAGEHGDGGFLE